MITTLEDLLRAYHDAKTFVISETGYSQDVRTLDLEVLDIANRLGIVWTGCDCKNIYYWDEEE